MSLSISQDTNIGSLTGLQLAPAYAFSAINPVTFNPNFAWDTVDFLDDQAQLISETTETDQGITFTYTLTFAFNKNNLLLQNSLSRYYGTIAIAKVTDSNGLTQIIGNQQSPLIFKIATDTGKKFTDHNIVVVTATVVQDAPAILP